MKKLILLATLVMSSIMFGQSRHPEKKEQHRKSKMEHLKDLSPEQIATLNTKKMTLALDLSNTQQKQVYALELENAKKRKEQRAKRQLNKTGEKPQLTPAEKFNRMNESLDKKIAHKNNMKTILSEEQFKKWSYKQQKSHQEKRKHLRSGH